MPNIAPALKYFEDAFDWSDAEKTGRITPHEGVDSDFDLGSVNIITIKRKLEAYLKDQQEYFKNQSVRAFSMSIKARTCLIVIPEILKR